MVKQIVDAKAQSRSLAEPWADTGRLMLAVRDGLADVEPAGDGRTPRRLPNLPAATTSVRARFPGLEANAHGLVRMATER
jgi:hypothetical protein